LSVEIATLASPIKRRIRAQSIFDPRICPEALFEDKSGEIWAIYIICLKLTTARVYPQTSRSRSVSEAVQDSRRSE
jgi:hypothetical protein